MPKYKLTAREYIVGCHSDEDLYCLNGSAVIIFTIPDHKQLTDVASEMIDRIQKENPDNRFNSFEFIQTE